MDGRYINICNHILGSYLHTGTVEGVLKAVEELHKHYGTDRDVFMIESIAIQGVIQQAAQFDDQEFLLAIYRTNRWNTLLNPAMVSGDQSRQTMADVLSAIQKTEINKAIQDVTHTRRQATRKI